MLVDGFMMEIRMVKLFAIWNVSFGLIKVAFSLLKVAVASSKAFYLSI